MTSTHNPTPACAVCLAQLEQLNARVSDLLEANANLKMHGEVMRRNQSLFKALLANSIEGIALTGPDRRIVHLVNSLTGFRSEDLTGVPIESLLVPEDQALIVDSYDRLMRRECARVTHEVRVICADESIRWFSFTITDMLDDTDVHGIVCNYIDLTRQKHAELEADAQTWHTTGVCGLIADA